MVEPSDPNHEGHSHFKCALLRVSLQREGTRTRCIQRKFLESVVANLHHQLCRAFVNSGLWCALHLEHRKTDAGDRLHGRASTGTVE
jgi:hypothetical protein